MSEIDFDRHADPATESSPGIEPSRLQFDPAVAPNLSPGNDAAMSERDLDRHIDSATEALLARQRADGHFIFELEADATVPAEYVLLRHYLGEPVDTALEAKIAAYLRRTQARYGGWALYQDGGFDMSATVKAYFALKMIGDPPQAEHMRRAREAIRMRGGAERSNVFTRCLLALYGIVPWRAASSPSEPEAAR